MGRNLLGGRDPAGSPRDAARRFGSVATGTATGTATTSASRIVTDSNAGAAPDSVRGRTGGRPAEAARGPGGGRVGAGWGSYARPRAAMGSGPH
nr:hypothetical protein KPHV_04730 [Kitasatospora purpeofusca]